MILQGWLQILIFFAVIVALTPLLGGYMARVYTPGQTVLLERVLGPVRAVAVPDLRHQPV